MDAQPRWAWWMVWAEWLTDPAYNTDAGVQASYFSPRVLNRGEITLTGGGGGTGGGPGKITGVPSGKCADVQWSYSAATQTLVDPATGRCLGAVAEGTADGTRLQIWTCNGKANQRWTIPG